MDYYQTLGVSKQASDEEIKKAYRRLARECHPDANPDDPQAEAKFKELGEAYAVLSDPERRRNYDRFGTAGPGGFNFDAFDIFASFFGAEPFNFGGRRGPVRGRDVAIAVEVSLEDLVEGVTKTFPVRTLRPCPECSGSGAKPGTTSTKCLRCAGMGTVRTMQRSFFGNVVSSTTCPECHGMGERVLTPCSRCRGEGRLEMEDKMKLEVPAGVEDGMQLRVQGKGEAAPRGGESGDLYVQIRVKPMPGFERHRENVTVAVEVPFSQAALGATLKIESFDGQVELDVPPGTQPGDTLRVKGAGVARIGRGGRGDLLVKVQVKVPTNLSADEEALLRRFAAMRGEDITGSQGIIDKIRSAFRG